MSGELLMGRGLRMTSHVASQSPKMSPRPQPQLIENGKEKNESLVMLVRHLRNENNSLRTEQVKLITTMKGLESVQKALDDDRQEIAKLKEDHRLKDIALDALQQRLDQQGLESDIFLREANFYLPTVSRDALQSLTKENMKLRSSLKNMPVDVWKVDKLFQQCKALHSLYSEAKLKLDEVMKEKDRLLNSFSCSQDEKSQQIAILAKEKSDLKQEIERQQLLCYSLTDEVQTLRERVHTSVAQTGTDSKLMTPESGVSHKQTKELEKRLNEVTSQFILKTEECKAFKEELEKLKVMNYNWQQYKIVTDEKIKNLEAELGHAREHGSITVEQQEQFDQMLEKAKTQKNDMEEEKMKVEAENTELSQEIEKLKKQTVQLQKENETLKKQIRSAPSVSHKDYEDLQTLVTVLKAQVEACTDDFNRERSDHRKAIKKVQDLEYEKSLFKTQLDQFQSGALPVISANRIQSINRQSLQDQQLNQTTRSAGARARERNDASRTPDRDQDVIDSLPSSAMQVVQVAGVGRPPKTKATTRLSKRNEDAQSVASAPGGFLGSKAIRRWQSQGEQTGRGNQEDQPTTLQCPKCSLQFSSSDHLSLMDHIEDCC